MSDEDPRSPDDAVMFAESSRAMVEMLIRASSVDSLLELICECARVDRAAHDPRTTTPHLWLCPAGTVEFWLSRHPAETVAWLDHHRSAGALPPEPAW